MRWRFRPRPDEGLGRKSTTVSAVAGAPGLIGRNNRQRGTLMKDLHSDRSTAMHADPLFKLNNPEPPFPLLDANELVFNSVPVGFNVLGGQKADEINEVATAGGYLPAYAPGTFVMDLVAARKARFVRIYDEDERHSGRVSPWLLHEDDIVGLTPRHIAGKFNLCSMPNMIAEVTVPAGTRVRMGVTPRTPHWAQCEMLAKTGGGIQYLLDAPRDRIPDRWFGAGRLLAKNRVISCRF